MGCRRCGCVRLIKLAKRLAGDNDVYRCAQCGYIFSPPYLREPGVGVVVQKDPTMGNAGGIDARGTHARGSHE